MESFYRDLPSFDRFEEVTMDRHYRTVPEEWGILITDVKNSTEAIQDGKYRDVNLIGASSLAIARNVMGTLEFPFSFGGDGATMLIPPEHQDELRSRLSGLQNRAREQFQLELRAGHVPVDALNHRTESLDVAKYEVASGLCVAIFRGGGIAAANELVKQQPDRYELSEPDPPEVTLEGLSCRWKPIPNQNGRILSLLVLARSTPKQEVYRDVLDTLDALYDGELQRGNPVHSSGLSYRSMSSCYEDEKRYVGRWWSVSALYRWMEIVLAVMLFRWNVASLFGKADHYRNALPNHSDYRKFDDMLRLTLDCSPQQIDEITHYLDERYQQKDLFYGHHESSDALMTCFVESLSDGEHVHFIDGGDGGYTMAAVQLKKQIRQAHDRS